MSPRSAVQQPTATRARTAAVLLAIVGLAHAHAQSADTAFSVAGFGTLGALYHDGSGFEYRREYSQPDGARSGHIDFTTDSRIGTQLNARFSSDWEAIVQVQSKHRVAHDWTPQLTWAAVKYSPVSWLTLRTGRMQLDIYPFADSRDVGYASLPVRPSLETFGMLVANGYHGADVLSTRELGTGFLEAKLNVGKTLGWVTGPDGGEFSMRGARVYNVNVGYTIDDWNVRIGAARLKLGHSQGAPALVTALRTVGTPEASWLADAFNHEERKISFLTLGAAYTPGALRTHLMVARTRSPSPSLTNIDSATFLIGHRFGQWTPYTVLSGVRSDRDLRSTGLPDVLGPDVAMLNAGVEMAQRIAWDNQHSLALGVRYDFADRFALKLQLDRVHVRDASVLLDLRPPPYGRETFSVYSMALDFMF